MLYNFNAICLFNAHIRPAENCRTRGFRPTLTERKTGFLPRRFSSSTPTNHDHWLRHCRRLLPLLEVCPCRSHGDQERQRSADDFRRERRHDVCDRDRKWIHLMFADSQVAWRSHCRRSLLTLFDACPCLSFGDRERRKAANDFRRKRHHDVRDRDRDCDLDRKWIPPTSADSHVTSKRNQRLPAEATPRRTRPRPEVDSSDIRR